jgi:glucose/mannose-6-phosphate isomerase
MTLDDLSKIAELDSENMFQMVQYSFEVPNGVEIGQYKISYEGSVSQIIICGMGGSAISGDYLRTYLEKTSPIPIIVQRKYNIPAFVGKDTLIILISYSGNTEETISCLISAIKKSAKIVGIGSGGRLKEFFHKYGLPFYPIISGYQPRASFPLLFFPLLKILDKMNLSTLDQKGLDETLVALKEMRKEFDPKIEVEKNLAKRIAKSMHNRIPIIWSPFGCVSDRMKYQLNENSKILAISMELPELNHNHIVGWENWTNDNPFIVIIFRFSAEHPNLSLRFEITKELISGKTKIIEINTRRKNLLSQLISTTYFGDYISIYLAILNNHDPNTVDSIDILKQQLEERASTQSELFAELFKLGK